MNQRWSMTLVALLGGGMLQCTVVPPAANDNTNPLPDGTLTTERVANGLSRPVYVTALPGDTRRLFIVEQHTGRIRILDLTTTALRETPFLTVADVSTGNEQGLLGLAFAPDYATTGRFYVNFTRRGETILARGTAAPTSDVANTALETLLTIEQPFSNHNGGWLGFGPDGYLYVASGDGGSGNDPNRTGQNRASRLGKMLRLDVSPAVGFATPDDNPLANDPDSGLLWALGLRNPWRCSFDRASGDLIIADVGQDAVEEIDVLPAGSGGGQNFGWRCLEGTSCTGLTGCSCDDAALIAPIHEYGRDDGCSITGGYVYRGNAIPDLQGTYFFADYCSDRIWSFAYDGSAPAAITERTAELAPGNRMDLSTLSSFGEDAAGELYLCDLDDGEVFRIVPRGS